MKNGDDKPKNKPKRKTKSKVSSRLQYLSKQSKSIVNSLNLDIEALHHFSLGNGMEIIGELLVEPKKKKRLISILNPLLVGMDEYTGAVFMSEFNPYSLFPVIQVDEKTLLVKPQQISLDYIEMYLMSMQMIYTVTEPIEVEEKLKFVEEDTKNKKPKKNSTKNSNVIDFNKYLLDKSNKTK